MLLDAAPSGADCVYIARSYKDSAPTERSSSPLSRDRRLTVFNPRGNSEPIALIDYFPKRNQRHSVWRGVCAYCLKPVFPV
jgi:hypothetical protein